VCTQVALVDVQQGFGCKQKQNGIHRRAAASRPQGAEFLWFAAAPLVALLVTAPRQVSR